MTRRGGAGSVGRFPDLLLGGVCLVAFAVMSVAAALPFLQIPEFGGIQIGNQPTPAIVHSLLDGYDRAWVIVILLIVGASAAGHLAGIGRRLTSAGCVGASGAALALGIFERSTGGSRVLTGGLGLPNTYGTSEHLILDAGFYLFLGAATVALVASLIMLGMSVAKPQPASGGSVPLPSPQPDPTLGLV